MMWRVANSLNMLLRQLNASFPNRDKSSDGSIGDEKHAERTSDHNPWVKDSKGQPIVTARDFTNDAPYMDSHSLALKLVESKDKRIKYIIDHKKICAGEGGPQPWKWRDYTGKNPHDHHVHVSVREQEKYYDDETPWSLASMPPPSATTSTIPKANRYPTLKVGATGADVNRLQYLLNANLPTAHLAQDGDFGPSTLKAVKTFQSQSGLVADGIVGPYTWKKLEV
jgi:hypothetical protein